MANIKITDLSAIADPISTDVLPIVDVSADTTNKISIADLLKNAAAGTAAAPAFAFDADPDTGVYRAGANVLAFSTNGTGRLFINSIGRVGIGTASPQRSVHVSGASTNILRLENTGANVAGFELKGSAGTSSIFHDGGALRFLPNGTDQMRITSAGNVGIGTSSPGRRLEVSNGSYSTKFSGNQIEFTRDSINYIQANGGTSSYLVFHTGGNNERLRIDSSGNVGIGTSSPTRQLQVSAATAQIALRSSDSTLCEYLFGDVADDNVGRIRYEHATNNLNFWTNAGERLRIDSSGRLLVGTSSSRTVGSSVSWSSQIEGTSTGSIFPGLSITAHSNSNDCGYLALGKTRGTSTGSNTIAQNNDALGRIIFAGADGTDLETRGAAIECFVDGTPGANDMPGRLVFATTADGASTTTERMRIKNDGGVYIGKTDGTMSNKGIAFEPYATTRITTDSTGVDQVNLYLNRQSSDGVLLKFFQANTEEGSISVSGTTVSYNGGHLSRWSQLPSGAERTDILRGTVLSNIDEMCEWGEEDNEQLNRMKVSDVEADKNVAGVFQAWDDDDDTYTNDFYCAMTGDFIIRIGAGVSVERGDLLMSAGDGTAKPQDDDIIRSKTIAKITSTNVSCTYADGSFCVPCVLMAC